MMCTVCGCDGGEINKDHHHDHQHHHAHDHSHDHHHHDHAHEHQPHQHDTDGQNLHYGQGCAGVHVAGQSQERLVQIERDILGKNNELAARNRNLLADMNIQAINLLSSPGSGKTTLLTHTLTKLMGKLPVAVIEGDQQTDNDAARIRETGAEAVQINTGKGCHLDADMVGHALTHMTPPKDGLLFIENVGNLVCPASFDLGEAARVVLASTTEGEDKPIKYPDMFATADIVLMTKSDLLPHLSFDVDAFISSVRAVNSSAPILPISVVSNEGMEQWLTWLDIIRTERGNNGTKAAE